MKVNSGEEGPHSPPLVSRVTPTIVERDPHDVCLPAVNSVAGFTTPVVSVSVSLENPNICIEEWQEARCQT